MVQRWLCISTRANDEVTRKKHIWGVAKRFVNTIGRVKKGDTLLMYTMQEIIDREVIPSAITSIYEAISDVYEDESLLFSHPLRSPGNEVFPLRIKLKPVKVLAEPLPFKPLVPEMSFIRNKVMWSGSLRTAMRVIPEEEIVKDQQELFLKKCHAISIQLINDYWPAVVALAENLHEVKRIPAIVVKQIVEETIPPEVTAVTKLRYWPVDI